MDTLPRSQPAEAHQNSASLPDAGVVPAALPRMVAMMPAAIASLSRKPRRKGITPQRALFRLPELDSGQVRAYCALLGSDYGALPLTYFYLLAQRAQLAMMIDRSYPYPIPGMIHTENALRLHHAPQLDRPFSVVITSDFQLDERNGERVRFDVQFKQNNQIKVHCRSDYLVRRPAPDNKRRSREPLDVTSPTDTEIHCDFGAFSGWRYARVSGDYNPIHLPAGLARLFGFRRPILQGMYGLAKVAAEIEALAERPMAAVSVRFRRPMQLPIRITARWNGRDTSGPFALYTAESEILHMHGEYELA